MRQVVSLIKDDQVHYALVDDDEGTLVPFASIHLPEPDRFGLQEAALLGTNLIEAIGLNGKRPKQRALPTGGPVVVHEHKGTDDMRTPPPKQKRNRPPRNDIHLADVVDIINQHPEGVTSSQIADQIWHRLGKQGDTEQWCRKGVENRIRTVEVDSRVETPFRVERRFKLGRNGLPTKLTAKYMLPNNPTTTTTQHGLQSAAVEDGSAQTAAIERI